MDKDKKTKLNKKCDLGHKQCCCLCKSWLKIQKDFHRKEFRFENMVTDAFVCILPYQMKAEDSFCFYSENKHGLCECFSIRR